MSCFDWRKNIENYIKDGLIITVASTGIFFALKTTNLKPLKASIDAMNIMKYFDGICDGK